MNNTRYADWLCNVLGIETMSSHYLETLNIHYNTEVRPGQSPVMRLYRSDNKVRLLGEVDGKPAFEIGAELSPIPE